MWITQITRQCQLEAAAAGAELPESELELPEVELESLELFELDVSDADDVEDAELCDEPLAEVLVDSRLSLR